MKDVTPHYSGDPAVEASTDAARVRSAAHRVVAIVTSFRPEPSLLLHCELLAEQVKQIVVVDDGSGAAADEVLTQLQAQGVRVVRQPENAGIADAINLGYVTVADYDPELVITFDQDSRVTPGFVAALVEHFDRSMANGLNVGMVAPQFFMGLAQTHMPQKRGFLEAYQPIQSGLLMPYAAIRQLGPQRGEFFIDSVDTEYYQRAIRQGYDCVCAPALNMPHSLGHMLNVRVFGRFLVNGAGNLRSISVSSPFRYYYRVRNRIILNQMYLLRSPRRVQMLRDTFWEMMHYGFAWYCSRGKGAYLSVLWAGLKAGLARRMGKIPDAVAETSRKVSWKHAAAAREDRA
ncbi:rhamnosyltransferase [Leucobacter exalbidus]|uniref:Rhamnosyltransferase n=1 Tax=Leucobacter exalbidus TaxID=662960 RepID=A0A940SZU8_9MICO|nr:glycosyltransferase [Leucobacter exalbidus]MBP1325260.1 rhamnosyltransferase [Leucobacter exalbidus]